MARLSDIIESFIKEMIRDTDGVIELQRNELAQKFQCVPSQINYVISTRFTAERGYYVESRRGGGGYISIKQVYMNPENPSNISYLMHIINSMGQRLSQHSCEVFINNFVDYEIVTFSQALVMRGATSDKALMDVPVDRRDIVRASILKNMLMSIGV